MHSPRNAPGPETHRLRSFTTGDRLGNASSQRIEHPSRLKPDSPQWEIYSVTFNIMLPHFWEIKCLR